MREPRAGDILVASPMLADPNFIRTVVFLLAHNDEGTTGLIVNRSLPLDLSEVWEDCPACLAHTRICADGGPVERGKGLLLHGDLSLPGAHDLGLGLAIGGDTEAVLERWPQGPDPAGPRLFLGRSGWALDQLMDEIGAGSWLVHAGHPRLLLDPDPADNLWAELICTCGEAPGPSSN